MCVCARLRLEEGMNFIELNFQLNLQVNHFWMQEFEVLSERSVSEFFLSFQFL